MTNEEKIRELLEDKLPELLIEQETQDDGSVLFITSDGHGFTDYETAYANETWWLSQEAKD